MSQRISEHILKSFKNCMLVSNTIYFYLPIYHIQQPYVKSYYRNDLDSQDLLHYLIINYKHFHLRNMPPTRAGIPLNTLNPRNQLRGLVLAFVGHGGEKNFL